jgi:hypothetical protein
MRHLANAAVSYPVGHRLQFWPLKRASVSSTAVNRRGKQTGKTDGENRRKQTGTPKTDGDTQRLLPETAILKEMAILNDVIAASK